jgi:hypothetical protein
LYYCVVGHYDAVIVLVVAAAPVNSSVELVITVPVYPPNAKPSV